MSIDDEVNAYLNHFGTRGMKWGVRKNQVKNATSKARRNRNVKRGAVAAGIGGAALAGAILSRRGMIPVSKANQQTKAFANEKSARVLMDIGSKFAKSSIDMQLLANSARQVSEGLIWDY